MILIIGYNWKLQFVCDLFGCRDEKSENIEAISTFGDTVLPGWLPHENDRRQQCWYHWTHTICHFGCNGLFQNAVYPIWGIQLAKSNRPKGQWTIMNQWILFRNFQVPKKIWRWINWTHPIYPMLPVHPVPVVMSHLDVAIIRSSANEVLVLVRLVRCQDVVCSFDDSLSSWRRQ